MVWYGAIALRDVPVCAPAYPFVLLGDRCTLHKGVNNLPSVITQPRPDWELNLWPLSCKSDALLVSVRHKTEHTTTAEPFLAVACWIESRNFMPVTWYSFVVWSVTSSDATAADENGAEASSSDSVTSRRHGDAVVAETDEPPGAEPVVESCRPPASVCPAATAAAALLTRQQVRSPAGF